jgi:hypothetical protein
MGDWDEDPAVIAAIAKYNECRSKWLDIAPDAYPQRALASPKNVAYERMKIADMEYVWARDGAIHSARLDYTFEDSGMRWPVEVKVSLFKVPREPDC